MKKENQLIKCPKCNKEYLPCEIYLPNSFLGKCKNIERDEENKITTYSGESMNLIEHFICDNCNTQFEIVAEVKFNTTTKPEYSFDEEYSSPLVKNNLFFDEN